MYRITYTSITIIYALVFLNGYLCIQGGKSLVKHQSSQTNLPFIQNFLIGHFYKKQL